MLTHNEDDPILHAMRQSLDEVRWRAPQGWDAPWWLDVEPAAALPMSPDRLRWCMQAIGWSQEELARRLDKDPASIRQMARGRRQIPYVVAVWLEQLAARSLGDASFYQPPGWTPGRRPDQAAAVEDDEGTLILDDLL